jgi:ribosomal-protein-alanine N-acetyltransferase
MLEPFSQPTLPPAPHEIRGDRLLLRDIQLDDATPTYMSWMNDPEVVRYTESRYSDHSLESLRKFILTNTESQNNLILAITTLSDNQHIGNIKLGNINFFHGSADIGIIIGDKRCWGKGYASETIELIIRYAFTTIGLIKLTAGVYAPNKNSTKAFEKKGFKREGLLKGQCRFEDQQVDVILLGLQQTMEADS